MICRWRTRRWLRAAVVLAVVAGLFWMAVERAERAGGSSAAKLAEAMKKAAQQRELTP